MSPCPQGHPARVPTTRICAIVTTLIAVLSLSGVVAALLERRGVPNPMPALVLGRDDLTRILAQLVDPPSSELAALRGALMRELT